MSDSSSNSSTSSSRNNSSNSFDDDDNISSTTESEKQTNRATSFGECLVYGDSLSWAMCHDRFAKCNTRWPSLLRDELESKGVRLVESHFYERTTCYDDFPSHTYGWNAGAEAYDFNGLHHFGTVFSSHSPRWLVLMLGTHDTKTRVRELAWRRKYACVERDSDTESQNGEGWHGFDPDFMMGDSNIVCDPRFEETDDYFGSTRPAELDAKTIAYNLMEFVKLARHMFNGHCHEGRLEIFVVVPPPLRLTDVGKSLGFDEQSVEILRQLPEALKPVCERYRVTCIHDPRITNDDSVDGIHLTPKSHERLFEELWQTIRYSFPRTSIQTDRYVANS